MGDVGYLSMTATVANASFIILLNERLQIIILMCKLEDGQPRTLYDRESGVGYVAKSGAASTSPD